MPIPPQDCPEPLAQWLADAVERQASDVHLVPGNPPVLRVHGELRAIDSPTIQADDLAKLLPHFCTAEKLAEFREHRDVDFSFTQEIRGELRRFRANLFVTQGQPAACLRVVPGEVPDLDWAGFPGHIADRLVGFRNGLVLITGVTGAGKTTTLAMLVKKLIESGNVRVITIEEPVEYVFAPVAGSVVSQREVGPDVRSFADGLKYGLRQDPDVILVGEIRDRETAQMALSAAETGHLVLSTLHTRDAKGAISRFTDLFPQSVQTDIRSQLAMSLRSIISQHLLPSSEANQKQVLALEILFNTVQVASAIRNGKLQSIDNSILTGRDQGMITLDETVRQLAMDGRISPETAQLYVPDGGRVR